MSADDAHRPRLAIDVGNTRVKYGLFADGVLARHWASAVEDVPGDDAQIGDSIARELRAAGYGPADIDAVGVACVVPALLPTYRRVTARIGGAGTRHVSVSADQVKAYLRVDTAVPDRLGADRIACAIGAAYRHGTPVIVVDVGTAIKFDVIGHGPVYLGGVIAPGLRTSLTALLDKAKLLDTFSPSACLHFPAGVIAQNSADALASGACFGFAELISGVLRRLRTEVADRPTVVGTGGDLPLLLDEVDGVDVVDEALALRGVYMIAGERLRASGGGEVW
jgi:type III pantothenate kinase